MFDPFDDFGTRGYLRNNYAEKDQRIVKRIEHELFVRKAPSAVTFLASKRSIGYEEFLKVHELLFVPFYPWAGKDRHSSGVREFAVVKGDIFFSHPRDAQRAVEHGLRIGSNKSLMRKSPGEVMGLFAYGHPFWDGNGRTMLLVHSELAYRAGFSIDWTRTNKNDYLSALSEEIKKPSSKAMDRYLVQFMIDAVERDAWTKTIQSMKGLDGVISQDRIEGDLEDAKVKEKYDEFESKRGYSIDEADKVKVKQAWKPR